MESDNLLSHFERVKVEKVEVLLCGDGQHLVASLVVEHIDQAVTEKEHTLWCKIKQIYHSHISCTPPVT